MQCKADIVPITINHYRNFTETTQNTLQSNKMNKKQQTKEQKKLKQIVNYLHSNADPPFQKQINKVLGSHKQEHTLKSKLKMRYKSKQKNQQSMKYEPILSTQGEQPSRMISKDEKEFTFGDKSFQIKKYENPENQKQAKNKQMLIISQDNNSIKKKLQQKEKINKFNKLQLSRKMNQKNMSTLQRQILQDKNRNPGKYAAGTQAGLSDHQIFQQSGSTLNFQLQKFIKKKGQQYMKDISLKIRSQSHKVLPSNLKFNDSTSTSRLPGIKEKSTLNLNQKQKYPNYIPEVFPHITDSRKRIKTEKKEVLKIPKMKSEVKSKQFIKYNQINEREEMLGKIVFDRVQDHFQNCKDRSYKYFMQVKSQQRIDEAWIEYLKTKIDRADYALSLK